MQSPPPSPNHPQIEQKSAICADRREGTPAGAGVPSICDGSVQSYGRKARSSMKLGGLPGGLFPPP